MINMHKALVQLKKGGPLSVKETPTPEPGENEVLIRVAAVAINPVDYFQKSLGFHVPGYPAILGYDASGTIEKVGSAVKDFTIGQRVIALAAAEFNNHSKYGAFQEYVLVPTCQITLLPDSIKITDGAVIPLAAYTSWFGLSLAGVDKETSFKAQDKKGIVIWGASGSVGSMAVQIAKEMGFTIYATASKKNHDYIRNLAGNAPIKMFDYNDEKVLDLIFDEIKKDATNVHQAVNCAGNQINQVVKLIERVKPKNVKGLVSCAPFTMSLLYYWTVPSFLLSVKVTFVTCPSNLKERNQAFAYLYNQFLAKNVAKGSIVPSPPAQVMPGGLEGVPTGIDQVKKGVSATKLVYEIATL